MLALHLFGPPRLELDGESVHIPRRKALALLAYLAVTGQSHSRDELATLLWPESNQKGARTELRRTLSVLRGVLGDGWLAADRETVRLKTEDNPSKGPSFWLDVADFQEKLQTCEGHDHPPTLTCLECLHALEEAVALFSDEFMAGFNLKDCPAYDEWQFFQREELRAGLTNALMQHSAHYGNEREYETAIGYARRWLELDGLNEAAHRQLMTLYDQAGQRAAAIRQYQACRQTLQDELGVGPSEETKELYQKIRTSTLLTAAVSRPKSNLPVQATPFIGRVDELAEIRAKLKDDECRLLTLLGPGGSGKTRLAIEAAGEIFPDFKHGAFFVNMGPLENPQRIPTTIASALNLSFYEGGTPEEQLLDYLRNKEMLLVLDNFEHLLAGVGFVNHILHTCANLKILATSRISLDLSCENIYDVWGMAYPDSPSAVKAAVEQYSAVRLFDSAAKRRQKSFELNDENIPDVIRVCSLLAGMPLGIVLAASWAKLLSPKEIATEIARDLTFLEKELQDLPERQRGMRGVFNHSWRLLSDQEQKILCALSVFRGGFTRDAAQAVAGASLGNLMSLIDQSILHKVADGRYEIHEMLRQFAVERLQKDPAIAADMRAKHSAYFCQALAIWERQLQGPQQGVARKEMTLEIDNIRAAWDWAVEKFEIQQLMKAINGLCLFFSDSCQFLEGAAVCRSLIDKLVVEDEPDLSEPGFPEQARITQIEAQKLQARALAWGGYLNAFLGYRDLANKLSQRCLSILEKDAIAQQDTRFEKALAYLTLPYVSQNLSRLEAKTLVEEALHLFEDLDEPGWVVSALEYSPSASISERIRVGQNSLAIRRKLGDLSGMAHLLEELSWAAANQFQFEEAEELIQEALAINIELDDWLNVVGQYGTLATQWVFQGKFIEARNLFSDTFTNYHDLEYTQSYAALIHVRASYPDLYLGDYAAARRQAEHAVELLKEVKFYFAATFIATANDVLGAVDLAEGSYQAAKRRFQESLAFYETNEKELERLSKTLAYLGYATRGLNHIPQAKANFYQALGVAIEIENYFPLIFIMPGIALLFSDQGEIERAVELYALAANMAMVANSKWFDDIAGDQIARAAEGLPAEVVKAAKARGRSLDLWETAKVLLAELDEKGWENADHQPGSPPEMEAG